jgi:hypothetical protein
MKNSEKIRSLKIKELSVLSGGDAAKKRGPQNEGICREVDENKGQVFHSFNRTRDVIEK